MPEIADEIVLKGIPASPGVASGEVFVFQRTELEVPSYAVSSNKREEEIARFERGLLETRRQISAIRSEIEERLGEEEALIFDAHQMVLEDRALIEETIKEVFETGYNIEHCFHKVATKYIEAFAKFDDAYLRERASDIRDVSRRLLQTLMGQGDAALGRLTEKKIIVANDLTPSDTATLERGNVLGIVTDQGGRTSHAVIMARSLGVPAVVGLHDATERLNSGDTILVDGYEGLIIINPNADTLFRYGKIRVQKQNIQKLFESVLPLPSVTLDNAQAPLYINIEGHENPTELRSAGATGVGLFRTEALFIRRDRFPSEEEQFQVYRRMVEGLAPMPVTIRTLDLGGDKTIGNNLFQYEEANPFMGYRAIRFCLENLPIFKDQLRAILRASAYGNVQIMFPMISSLEELLTAKQVLEEAKAELSERGQTYAHDIKIGSMIEIPSAAYSADLLAAHCDFFSIGTNDLIQYMLAVDRVNDRIAHLYQPSHPAILRTIKHIIESGRKAGIEVSICGEMAGDPIYAPLLFGFGASELSVTPTMLPEIKFLMRNLKLTDVEALSTKVLQTGNPKDINDLLRNFYFEKMGTSLSA